jgi:hypothetical protein
MAAILKIHEATVQTVQVEIKALKVGKKQVTMGLFRQLPLGELLDTDTLQLRGLPWGRVNYWWEGDGRDGLLPGNKVHVVWQAGDELRRAVVNEEPDRSHMQAFREQERAITGDFVLHGLREAKAFAIQRTPLGRHHEVTMNDKKYTVEWDIPTISIAEQYWRWRHLDPEGAAQTACQWWQENKPEEYAQRLLTELARRKQEQRETCEAYTHLLLQRGLLHITREDVLTAWRNLVDQRKAYQDGWAAQWRALNDLPQLFIAV